MTVGAGHFLILGAVIVGIGLIGTLARRDGLGIVLSIEVMFAGIAVAVAGLTRVASNPAQPRAGLALALVVAVAGVSQGLVGVAVVVLAHRRHGAAHAPHQVSSHSAAESTT